MTYSTNKEIIRNITLAISVLVFIAINFCLKNSLKQFIEQGFLLYLIFVFTSFFFGIFIIYYLISKIFFKIPFLKNTIPNFNGLWKGKGKSSFNDAEFDIEMDIKQDLRRISANCYFSKSKSESINVFVEKNNNKEKLYFNYFNEPKNTEENLDCHYGTIILEKIDKNTLEGNYFTNRRDQTKGFFKLEKNKTPI